MPDSFLEKRLYSTRNLIYMCQFAKTYPMEILLEMSKVEKQLSSRNYSATPDIYSAYQFIKP